MKNDFLDCQYRLKKGRSSIATVNKLISIAKDATANRP